MGFPLYEDLVPCPVEGCDYQASTRNLLRRHFVTRHDPHQLHIEEEGNLLPCELCGMQVTPYALTRNHRYSALCNDIAQRRRQRDLIHSCKQAGATQFQVADAELESVTSFRYLGRPLSYLDSDQPAMYRALTKARQRWGMLSRLLVREGADARVSGMFYKAVVQSVLLYGSETWVRSQAMDQVLAGFHHRVARRLSGRLPTRYYNGTWYYPPIEEALEAAGLYPMSEYLARRRATIFAHVRSRPIYELCQQTERLPGSSTRTKFWWDEAQD